jgi:predicted ATPase/DNA-binding SARP family transcriptional activator
MARARPWSSLRERAHLGNASSHPFNGPGLFDRPRACLASADSRRSAATEFRILGGLEALEGERKLALGSPQQRVLLGALLLSRGRAVPLVELIDAIWPERAPATASHAIEVYVSRLRKVLGGETGSRLIKEGQGYALRVDDDELDARRFELIVEEGRAALAAGDPVRAAGLLRDALTLWHGQPLGDLHCGPLVRAASARLEELRVEALEARIEAELALGRKGLIPELETLVAEEPLRERFRAQLMLALYREGRQADALRAYQSARTMFRDELGLEPGRGLQKLERDILNQSPNLEPAAAPPQRRATLPARITPLVGRGDELDYLIDLIRSDAARLVTITGAGGVGKTRLAVEAARCLADGHVADVVFVDLAPTRSPDLVVQTIAGSVEVREQPGVSLLDTLAAALSDRPSLLVLDNFEHVLEAAPVVAELLAAADRVKVLATSRTRLRLYGEHEYALSPLPVPPSGDISADELVQFEAVELFVSCTRRRVPGFRLDRENGRVIAEICIRLEGMPLALELAAARSETYDPEALLGQLGARLPILVGGPRDVPERHRSLRRTIDWSYDLLDEDERRLFARLSVFAGGFTAEAAAAVCGGDRPTFDSLVENSLVVRERERYSLLETLREYGSERLRDDGTLDDVRLRHAEFFVTFAERAEPELRGLEQLPWLARLDAEQPNIWAAADWGLTTGRANLALRLGGALWRYWEARGSISQARRRLDEVLAAPEARDADARAAALFASGRMALRQGDLEHAASVFAEARSLFEGEGNLDGLALCMAGLGWVAHVVGPLDEAVVLCEEAVALARSSSEEWVLADALNNLGVALRSDRRLEESRQVLEESLTIRRRIGDLEGVTASLNGLALIALADDDFDDADRLFSEAFVVSEQRGDLFYAAAKDIVFAYLAFGRGDLARSTRLAVDALESCRQNGYQQFAAYALETLAGVAAAEGRLRHAARVLGAAVVISERVAGERARRSQMVAYDWEARAVKQALEQARNELGADAWEAAMTEGRQLAIEEALAYVAEWTTATTPGHVAMSETAG